MKKKVPPYQKDLEILQEKLNRNPQDIITLLDLGFLFFESAHLPEEALKYYKMALEIEPNNLSIMLWIALAQYFEKADFHAARNTLEKALGIDPGHPACLSLYADLIKEYSTPPEEYLIYLRKALKRAPNWSSLYQQMAIGFAELGQWEEAEAELAKAYEALTPPAPPPANAREAYLQRVIIGNDPSSRDFLDEMAERIHQRKNF